jgi:hypothetical protein
MKNNYNHLVHTYLLNPTTFTSRNLQRSMAKALASPHDILVLRSSVSKVLHQVIVGLPLHLVPLWFQSTFFWLYLAVVFAGCVQSISISFVRWNLWLVFVLSFPLAHGWRFCTATISARSASSMFLWRLAVVGPGVWSLSMFVPDTENTSSKMC